MDWLKSNAATVIGWLLVAGTVAVSTGAQLQVVQDTAILVDVHDNRLHKLESDVRVLDEVIRRQDSVLTRQEQTTRELDRLVIELKTVVKGRHD